MKKLLVLLSLIGAAPLFASAQVISDASANILNLYSIISAIVVALVASLLVFFDSQKMKGGVFGTALLYFSLGMFCLLVGYIAGSTIIFIPDNEVVLKLAHDVLYTIGYVLMAAGAHKIYKTIGKN